MKYKFSQVTKKSVSLLLAILMMFSMLTIGITANAEGSSYYMHWNYNTGQDFNNHEGMTSSDSDTYTGILDLDFTGNNKQYCIKINDKSTDYSVSSLDDKTTYIYDSIKSKLGWGGKIETPYYNGYTFRFEAITTFKLKVEYKVSTNTVTLTEDTGSTGGDTTYNVTTGVKVSTDGTTYNVSDAITAPTGGGDTVSATTGTTLTASTPSDYTFVGWEVSGGAGISGTNTSVSYTPTANTTVYALYKKNYTVTIGTHDNGTITIDDAASNKTVPAGTEVTIVASPSNGYEFSAWTGDLSTNTNATVTMNVVSNITADATFTATSTPAQTYYYGYWDGKHNYIEMNNNNGVYTYEVTQSSNQYQDMGDNRFSFKITNGNRTGENGDSVSMNIKSECVNYNIPIENIEFKGKLAEYPVSFDTSNDFHNLFLSKAAFSKDTNSTLVIKYTPGGTSGLEGKIEIWTKDEYTPQPTTPTSLTLSQTTANLGVGDTVTLKATHKAGCATKAVTFESDNASVATVSDAGVVTAVGKGTATITATCATCGTATCTVTVSIIPFAVADRIYAYAGGSDTNLQSDAWVCSEDASASKINTHTDKGKVQPKLGSTSATNLRIFLPTTVGNSVLLYNSFSYAVTINGVEIQPNTYESVPFESDKSYNFTVNGSSKSLKLYKSAADGALYLNNTGAYAGLLDDGSTVKMYDHLFSASDKDASEMASGNRGAVAYGDTVSNVAVKKVKGRGNSTWRDANKKSFNVNFDKNLDGKINKDFKGKKYSLLANFKDPSLSRNKILYQLAKDMGVKYVPATATVDVYMNGLYLGSYLMTQKVEVGSKDVVNDLGKTLLEDLYKDSTGKVPDTAATDIQTNGFSFLIELDSNAGTGDFYTSVNEAGFTQKITIKEPEYLNSDNSIPTDPVTTAAKTFVENQYKELIKALNNTSITLAELNEIVDVDSLVKYFLVNEIAKNYDIGVSSTYFVYNYNAKKFYASPLWDMDVSTGNCKSTIENYQSYKGNWTDNLNDGTVNNFMKRVFANPAIQSAARKLWTADYYTTLTTAIDNVYKKSIAVEGSLNNNYAKWNYPYGFQGDYKDNVQARTELKVAAYTNGNYTEASSNTSYENTAKGQIDFIKDWLTSRVAWMTNKYNKYYIVGTAVSDWNSPQPMENSSGINKFTRTDLPAGTYQFKICSDGGGGDDKEGTQAYRDWTATSISYSKDLKLVSTTGKITNLGITDDNNNTNITFTTSETMTVYFTYNQKTNTVTLSDTTTTNTDPIVTLEGSTVANEDRVSGTAVTLTATVNPAVVDSKVVAGDYTVTLYRGIDVVKTETVTFADTDDAETVKEVIFNTALTGSNDSYTVGASITVDTDKYTGTSTAVSYVQSGQKNNKIYFDPSSDSNWKAAIDENSTVTVTVGGKTFKMIIDPENVHALTKGVFRAMVDDETLTAMQNNTVTFTLDGSTSATAISTSDNESDITKAQDGYIYTYDTKNGSKWCQYNVPVVPKYPGGCNNYQEFEAYLKDQADPASTKKKDNIVYFDNSASEWYNVFIYDWNTYSDGKDHKNAVMLEKLPYANIWYYDFGESMPTNKFLFKDRSNNAYGTNYQQTVDLVGKLNGTSGEYVLNGNGEKDYLNFENTISTPNPIFVTANFYNCTQQGENETDLDKKLKYRAFNTEWKEFYTVATSAVRTKAIDVYFDMHESTNIDNIQLYHSTKDEDKDGNPDFEYTFASKFTRLNRLPGSNIYYASIQLPYTTADGITTAFNFDKFVVNYSDSTTAKSYNMSAAVQPKKNCFTTGEVWYEFDLKGHSNTVSADTSTVSSSSSAKKLSSGKSRISSGANATVLPSGYSMTYATVKFVKPNSWTDARMVIGNGDNSQMISKINQDNGNVYTFEIKNYNNYDGFYFGDFDTDFGYANQDYYTWANNLSSGHVTSKIQNQSSGVTYRLVSGSSGDVEIVPDTTITTIYVYKGLTINSSTAKRLYAWYTDSSSNKVEPLGNGNNTNGNLTDTVTKTIEKIGGVDYYRFDFGCSANTFNFEVNDNSTNKITRENLPAGKTYFVNSNNTVDILTTFYINKELVISKNGVESKVANIYAWTESTNYSGTWPGSSLENSVQINGKEYYVTTVRSNVASNPSSLDSLNFILNTENGSSQTYTMTKNVGGTYRIDDGFVYDNHTCKIIDSAPIEYSVALDNTTLSLDLYSAKSSTLTVTPKGFDVNTTGSWTSNAEGVATVDNGTVTAVGVGTATITVTYTEDEIVKSATCTVTVTDSTPADAINSFTVNGSSTETITLSGNPASATASLAIDITNPSKTVSYSITKGGTEVTDESVAKVDGTTFTATSAGTYVVTATINGTDISKSVTITVNQGTTTVTDYCGILGYNHITATFESTTGGKIDNAYVTLTNGYYQDAAYETGYKKTDGDVITVIYALVDKTIVGKDTSVTIKSTTSKADKNSDYKFDDWTKNETMFSSDTELSDSTVNSTSTVNYVANWSVEKKVDYTLIYNYKEYNKSTVKGVEYDESAGTVDATPYKVKVKINKSIVESINTDVNSKKAILDLYTQYDPKISSDYFDYSFDNLTVDKLVFTDTTSVSGMAEITKTKTYSVTLKDVGGTPVVNKEDFGVRTSYYYQNIVTLTNSNVSKGKTTVWKNADTDVIIGYGNTYKFRITKNITISYEVVESTSLENRTFVNAPTYEFYTDSKNQQRVRFNFLVENYPTDISKVSQYGVLYFFTDKDGNPLDSTIAEDKDSVSTEILESAALGASTGIMKTDFTKLAEKNNNRKYIFAPTLSYTSANIDRYLRVYSYFITKGTDKDGKEIDVAIVSEPTSCILGSIREAIS